MVVVSLHSSSPLPRTEVSTRVWNSAVPGIKPCFLLVECGLWISKTAEHIKLGSMGHTNRTREDKGVESNVDYDNPAHRFQRRLLVISLEIILGIFWGRMWLIFALI